MEQHAEYGINELLKRYMNMDYPKYAVLPWDSDFFGFRVGRIDVAGHSPSLINFSIARLKDKKCSLIYMFSADPLDLSELFEKDVILVDIKRNYINKYPVAASIEEGIRIERFEGDSTELYDLGFQAGIYSRYRTDPRISDADFRRLYRQWVDNSVNGSFADYVLTCRVDNEYAGFITARILKKSISIGLIAVKEEMRGRGIGKALMNEILKIGADKGLSIEVVTQADNIPACSFYERLGFEILKDTAVYHVRPE